MQSEFTLHFQQAQEALTQRDFKAAHRHIRWLLRTNPDHLEALVLRGVYHRDRGQLEQAANIFAKAIQKHPDQTLPYLNRSKVHLQLNNTAEAIEDMAMACRLAPRDANLLNRYAELLVVNRKFKDAIEPLSELLSVTPQNLPTAYNLGRCLLEVGQFSRAEPLLKRVIEAAPADPRVARDYAILLDRLGRPDEALAVILPLVDNVEQSDLHLQCAWLLESTGQLEKATALLENMLKRTPDDLDMLSRAARVANKQNDKQRHQHLLSAVVAAAQQNAHPSRSSFEMWALFELGRVEDAFGVEADHFNVLPWTSLMALAQTDSPAMPPTLLMETTPSTDRPVIFAAGDRTYFDKFAGPLIQSALQNAPGWQVHLHVVLQEDQDPPHSEDQRVSLSYEISQDASKTCLACKRFTLLPKLLQMCAQPIICVDMDTLVNQSPAMALDQSPDADSLVYLRPDSYGFSQMVAAGFTAVRPSQGGQQFAAFVAAYCEHFLRAGQEKWFLDQMALGAAYALSHQKKAPFTVAAAPLNALDFDRFEPGSLIWAAKGNLQLPELSRPD